MPVIGNGDVRRGEDARRMRDQTGCDGVMIARGSHGAPWLFLQSRAALDGSIGAGVSPTCRTRFEICVRHAENAIAFERDAEQGGPGVPQAPGLVHQGDWWKGAGSGSAFSRSVICGRCTKSWGAYLDRAGDRGCSGTCRVALSLQVRKRGPGSGPGRVGGPLIESHWGRHGFDGFGELEAACRGPGTSLILPGNHTTANSDLALAA